MTQDRVVKIGLWAMATFTVVASLALLTKIMYQGGGSMYLVLLAIVFVVAVICSCRWDEWQSLPWLAFFVCLAFPFASFMAHSQNLGIIRSQKHVVAVYEQRVTELNQSLKIMMPEARVTTQMLLNADSPVASIIKAVNEASSELTEARAAVAKARVSISIRESGPFSFIVKWYGTE